MTPIHSYRADNGDVILFHPSSGVPGFTHRVIINGRAIDWLGDHMRPSTNAAVYFWTKHHARNAA